jgi:hypothetical protein
MLLAVKTAAVATPCALLTAVFTPPANVPLAPLAGAVNVTVTPLTGLLRASFTVACMAVANAVLIDALCGVPAVAVMLAGAAAARLVSEKFAGVATPATDAVTVYAPPTMLLAVNVVAVATPCALLTAVFAPPANVPLAPLAGAVNVTVTPLTGLLKASFTVACIAVANAVLTVVLCGVPAVAVMVCAVPPLPLAARNATICMIQGLAGESGAVAL